MPHLLQEALAIVLDVGPGMSQASDEEATFFERSRSAINMILQRKVRFFTIIGTAKPAVSILVCRCGSRSEYC